MTDVQDVVPFPIRFREARAGIAFEKPKSAFLAPDFSLFLDVFIGNHKFKQYIGKNFPKRYCLLLRGLYHFYARNQWK